MIMKKDDIRLLVFTIIVGLITYGIINLTGLATK